MRSTQKNEAGKNGWREIRWPRKGAGNLGATVFPRLEGGQVLHLFQLHIHPVESLRTCRVDGVGVGVLRELDPGFQGLEAVGQCAVPPDAVEAVADCRIPLNHETGRINRHVCEAEVGFRVGWIGSGNVFRKIVVRIEIRI